MNNLIIHTKICGRATFSIVKVKARQLKVKNKESRRKQPDRDPGNIYVEQTAQGISIGGLHCKFKNKFPNHQNFFRPLASAAQIAKFFPIQKPATTPIAAPGCNLEKFGEAKPAAIR